MPTPSPEDFLKRYAHDGPERRALRKLFVLLSQADPAATGEQAVEWLETLGEWLMSARGPDAKTGRLHSLLDILTHEAELRATFRASWAAILARASIARLLSSFGLPSDRGFFEEASERLLKKLLPRPPDPSDLSPVLLHLFPQRAQIDWLEKADPKVLAELFAPEPSQLIQLKQGVREAALLVAARVASMGLANDIQVRSREIAVGQSPFLRLSSAVDEQTQPGCRAEAAARPASALLGECRRVCALVMENLEASGVSVDLVYRLETLAKGLTRLEELLRLLEPGAHPVGFLAGILRDARHEQSLRGLVQESSHQLARKIAERAGEHGEHYVTTTRKEYWVMLAAAAGGGVLTSLTTFVKFQVSWLTLPHFFDGLFQSLNYGLSFLFMQYLGLTLATKQPSMTAAVLARTLKGPKDEARFARLTDLVARMVRSQVAAAVGNLGLVIPAALALNYWWLSGTGQNFLDGEAANYVVHSLDPLGSATMLFAALTGGYLWLASVAGGWLENWVIYRRVPEALEHHRGLRRILGVRGARWVANSVSRNVSGWGVNLALGFLLGMAPVLGRFFGVSLDVRHVTLSTGALALSAASLGTDAMLTPEFGRAIAGIAVIGTLNFGVSFALALAVAVRATGLPWVEDLRLVGEVGRRLLKSPGQFLFPPASPRPEPARDLSPGG